MKIDEMPWVDANIDFAGKKREIIDLRIEMLPVSSQEKDRFFSEFEKKGLVGELDGELYHFKPDSSVEVVTHDAAKNVAKLPHGWEKVLKFFPESIQIPSMKQVFGAK